MASMRDIKRRKGSIQSTQQITKAMKLVATVKLQKAKTKAEESKPYFDSMYQAVSSILSHTESVRHPYLESGEGKRKAVIVITSNRGLAGGYNSNVTRLITRPEEGTAPLGPDPREDTVIYAVGKKGREALERGGYRIARDYSQVMEEPSYADAMRIAKEVLDAFVQGEIGEIYLAYTVFKNTVVHVPVLLRLLPVDKEQFAHRDGGEEGQELKIPMNFEMDEVEALKLLIPQYITSMIYGGLLEASASENGARMQAMDSATSNADEMIEDLTLLYNRARQGSITQELTEIIAGAQAIS